MRNFTACWKGEVDTGANPDATCIVLLKLNLPVGIPTSRSTAMIYKNLFVWYLVSQNRCLEHDGVAR